MVELLEKKEKDKNCLLTYQDIAYLTGYHVKYVFKLKKDIKENKFSFEHGNKNKKPINALSEIEKEKIISLYKRSNASILKFCKFYNTRSYSCIYNLVKDIKK